MLGFRASIQNARHQDALPPLSSETSAGDSPVVTSSEIARTHANGTPALALRAAK
jgi:hypothetical protein